MPVASAETELVPIQATASLVELLDTWREQLNRTLRDPSAGNAQQACFVSQQVWLTYFSEAAPFGFPPERLVEIGGSLVKQFDALGAVISAQPSGTKAPLSIYGEKLAQRAGFIRTMLDEGTEAVLPLLDEAIDRELAAVA